MFYYFFYPPEYPPEYLLELKDTGYISLRQD